jgi:hypothetical protein
MRGELHLDFDRVAPSPYRLPRGEGVNQDIGALFFPPPLKGGATIFFTPLPCGGGLGRGVGRRAHSLIAERRA